MAGFIDIACNFTHDSFKDNLETVILNAEIEQVEKFVLLCASLNDLKPIKKIQKSAPQKFFISAGIHPHHAIEVIDIDYQELLNKLKSISPNAIGETGLDFYYNNSEKGKQIASFKEHIDASIKTNIPLIIHSRDAEKETFEILNEYKNENYPFHQR